MFKSRKMVINRYFLLFLVVIVITCQIITGCGNSNINEAEKLIDAGMYVEAATFLEQEIMNSPTNVKAYVLLGMTNIYLGNVSKARKHFQSAFQLNPGTGNRIGQFLLKFATDNQIQQSIDRTYEMLNMAVNFDPSLKNAVGKYYLDLAKTGRYSVQGTSVMLHRAVEFDSSTQLSASDILLEKASTLADAGKLKESYRAVSSAINFDLNKKDAGLKILIEAFTKTGRTLPFNDAESVVESILSIDEGAKDSIGTILLKFARESLGSGNINPSIQWADFIVHHRLPVPKNEIRSLLIDTVNQVITTLPFNDAESVVESILSIDEGAKDSIGTILLKFARESLGSGNINPSIQWADFIVHHRLPVPKNEIRSLLIDAANQSIVNEKNFVWAMNKLISHFSDISRPTTQLEKYIYGAYLWLKDDKSEGVKFLRQVSDVKKEELGIKFVDNHIPVGQYQVGLSQQGGFGWGTFNFTIDSVEVKPDKSTQVKIRVKNYTNRRQHFIFFGTQGEKKRIRYANASRIARAFHGGEDERFYILDEFGNKLHAQPPHFVDTANREEFNSTNDAVILEPGQVIIEELSFPQTSRGNTRISFVSPMHNGHQAEIRFNNINLRRPKFYPWNGD